MKKIKRLKDIEHEKLRLRLLQLEQEKALQQSWNELKTGISPLQIIQRKWVEAKQENSVSSLVDTIVGYSTEYVSRHFGEWAGNSLHKKLDKLAETLRTGKTNQKTKTT